MGGSNSHLKARRKKVLIAALLILLLALIGGAGWARLGSRQQPAANIEATEPCKDTSESGVLREASAFLDARKSAQLQPIAAKIQAIKDYDKDPNCLNIIATYYVNISDVYNASTYMGKLEAVYDPGQGFSKVLGFDAKSMETLREDLAFLLRQEELMKKNIKRSPIR